METTSLSYESDLINKDRTFVWHPFTQAKTAPTIIPIASGKGSYLFGYDGTRYLDVISSWLVTLHGHAHPVIAARIAQQASQLEQVIFTDFTHAGAVTLAERLVNLLKLEKGRVFYSDNGSTAVETALKIALQFWNNHSPTHPKTKIVCFQNAYHGDTFGAMSVSGKTAFNTPFLPFLFEVQTIIPPYFGQEDLSYRQLQEHVIKGDVACFIFEPIIQGISGIMQVHSAEGLNNLIKLCHQHEVITIADEVMTGFGRTGPIFAADRLSFRPDITCLSKGLTGGFLPLGATVCREEIYEGFLSDSRQHALLHGHSYCGNPLACAAALASIDLLVNISCEAQRKNIEHHHQHFAIQYKNHPSLTRCDVVGTILALEYKNETNDKKQNYFSSKRDKLMKFFINRNILVRPFGNLLYLMPPYSTTSEDLIYVYECIKETLEKGL